jgi:hypothetical protein
MAKPYDLWLRFGCFLTGYRYDVVRGCSELSAKRVKRFTSAMIIISILWAFVGYTFSDRYLKTEWYGSALGSLTTLIIVIQIERIIIHSPRSKWLTASRILLGFTMAIIGSVIIDQILFAEDIEKEKLFSDQDKIDQLFQKETAELRKVITGIDSALLNKERERQTLNEEITKKPTLTYYSKHVKKEKNPSDSLDTEVIVTTATQQPNPKIEIMKSVDEQIERLVKQKRDMEMLLLNLRPTVEAKVKKNVGFLDELDVMISLVAKSGLVLIVWMLWIVILLTLELLVLLGKLGEKDTDYDLRLEQQKQLHMRRIELLANQ